MVNGSGIGVEMNKPNLYMTSMIILLLLVIVIETVYVSEMTEKMNEDCKSIEKEKDLLELELEKTKEVLNDLDLKKDALEFKYIEKNNKT